MEEALNSIQNVIVTSCQDISRLIRENNTDELSKTYGNTNESGDDVKSLDLLTNTILKDNLSKCSFVKAVGSEEEDSLYITDNHNGNFLVCYDPLDGSSNISVNITTGTIFAVYEYRDDKITDGNNIVMAGYCLYGGATQLIVAREKLNMYQLYDIGNPNEHFKLVKENYTMPQKGPYYSLNDSNKYRWYDKRYNALIDRMIASNASGRWVGSLVADGHRTLIRGGFFAYPDDSKNKNGKIRLLYEAYPFAYIFKIAGGISSNGKINMLDIPYPDNCHQKTPIILSSNTEYDWFTYKPNTIESVSCFHQC